MSTDSAEPATISNESTVDIMAAVIAASMMAPSVAGRTAVATIGMARSPVGSAGKSTIAESAKTKTSRLIARIMMIAKRTPRPDRAHVFHSVEPNELLWRSHTSEKEGEAHREQKRGRHGLEGEYERVRGLDEGQQAAHAVNLPEGKRDCE